MAVNWYITQHDGLLTRLAGLGENKGSTSDYPPPLIFQWDSIVILNLQPWSIRSIT